MNSQPPPPEFSVVAPPAFDGNVSGRRRTATSRAMATLGGQCPSLWSERWPGRAPACWSGSFAPAGRERNSTLCWTTLPAQAPQRPALGRGQPGRAGLPADLRVMADLDRVGVRRPALLRPQRHRPPQPRRAECRDQRLHTLAEQPCRAGFQLRPRMSDPRLARVPGPGFLMLLSSRRSTTQWLR